jgi:hypothetical protein
MRHILILAMGLATASVAWAAPSLDAQVLLVEPDHSGRLPPELRSMRKALSAKGYDGASVASRRQVHLEQGRTLHVDLGRRQVDLTLLSVQGDQATVRVQRGPKGKPCTTTVATDRARFYVTAPR